jgi:hypothetical protein
VNSYCGDDDEAVMRNREALCIELGLDNVSSLIIPHQVHGVEVREINKKFLSLAEKDRNKLLEGVDAVMTQEQGICIGVSTADCIPVLLYDAEHHCAAAIHAGWRGTVTRIVERTIKSMTEAYGSRPEKMQAVIGPGISLENFEVGQEVYDAFLQADFPMDRIAVKYPMKWHINLPYCNQLQLEKAGVPPANINNCGVCTYDRTDDYFSARRLGINSGRIYTGILLH